MSTPSKFVVMTSTACAPGGFGSYGNVAVVETDGTMPCRIDIRLANVRSIPFYRASLNKGKTDRCAFRRALAQAEEFAAQANAAIAAAAMPASIAA